MIQPDYPAALGLLSHLNSDELKDMLNDDTKFDSVLKDMKQIKDWESSKEIIIASNRSLAEFNLSKESELIAAKEKIAEMSALGEDLCTRIREKLDEYKSKSAGLSLDTTLALIQTAAAECEEKSEAIAQSFLSGEMELDKFLEEFESARKVMHLRKFKAEKMTELIRTPQQVNLFGPAANTNPYTPYQPQHGYPYPQSQPSVPYPVGAMNMPMPGLYSNHF